MDKDGSGNEIQGIICGCRKEDTGEEVNR